MVTIKQDKFKHLLCTTCCAHDIVYIASALGVACISQGMLINTMEQIALKYQWLKTVKIYFWLIVCGHRHQLGLTGHHINPCFHNTQDRGKVMATCVLVCKGSSAWKTHMLLLFTSISQASY